MKIIFKIGLKLLLLIFFGSLIFSKPLPKLIPFYSKGKWGYSDSTKRIIIPCIYDNNDFFSDGLASVKKYGKWGFIDTAGNLVIEFIYDGAADFNNGVTEVKRNKKVYLINKTGREIYEIDKIVYTEDGPIVIKKNNKCFFSDSSGQKLIPDEFDDIWYFKEGYAIIFKNGKSGFINRDLKVVIPPKYDWVSDFENGIAIVCSGKKKWLIDKNDKMMTFRKYHDIKSIWDPKYYSVKIKNKFGLIDTAGNDIIKPKYQEFSTCRNGKILAKIKNKWGLITISDSVIIPFKYESLGWYDDKNSIIGAKNNKKRGLLDSNGNIIVPCIFDNVFYIYNYYWGSLGSKDGLIEKTANGDYRISEILEARIGDFLLLLKYFGKNILVNIFGFPVLTPSDQIWINICKNGFYKIRHNNKEGFIDEYGRIKIPIKYQVCEIFSDDYTIVKYNNEILYIDKYGTEYWDE